MSNCLTETTSKNFLGQNGPLIRWILAYLVKSWAEPAASEDRAVQGTFAELCGSSEDQELGMEQFQMAATPIIGERCTIFF